ncbi:GGDEF domain-containing protein [Acetobacterium sp.]|uniref:GGDEF domain-containing protein n=1 Tax=Acetobacterium sp. TaxID=1872094 RepID=UPI0035946D1D
MFREKLAKFLTNNHRFTSEDPQFRQVLMLNCILLISIFILAVFSLVAYRIALYPVMISNSIGGVVAILALYDFHQRHFLHFTSVLMVLIEMLILLVLFWFVGLAHYVLVWIVVIPITAYFLLGRIGGRIFTISFSLIVLSFILLRYSIWEIQGFSIVGMLNLGFAYLALILTVSYYELTMQEVLENLERKNKELAVLSVTDRLTGAYNRIKLDEILFSEIVNYRRTGKVFSILICDIDFFKQINDNFGHLFGDMILKEITQLMRQIIGESDICGRWGGEEFMIICLKTPLNEAVNLAEKLRLGIEDYSRNSSHRVTMSFGVTEFIPSDTIETLIKRSDDALYLAKQRGRNRVEIL